MVAITAEVVTTTEKNFKAMVESAPYFEQVALSADLTMDEYKQRLDRITDDVNARITPALAPLASATAGALLSQVTDIKFISRSIATPAIPTADDLAAHPGDIVGSRLTGRGAVQPVVWNRASSLWQDAGQPGATLADTDAALAGGIAAAAFSRLAINGTKAGLATKAPTDGRQFADGSWWDADVSNTRGPNGMTVVTGKTCVWVRATNNLYTNAWRDTLPPGRTSIPEENAGMVYVSETFRAETFAFGKGANATVMLVNNLPGAFAPINGTTDDADLAAFGVDLVGLTINFDINPNLYLVRTGVASYFSAHTFTASGINWGLLRKGMMVRTTHLSRYYGDITGWDQASNTVQIGTWRNGITGVIETPPTGTGAVVLLNAIDKAFTGYSVLGISADSPIRVGTVHEFDLNMSGTDVTANILDLVTFGNGANSVGSGLSIRAANGAGRVRTGVAVLGGAYDRAFYSGPDAWNPTGPRPQVDLWIEHATAAGIVSKGDRSHMICRRPDDFEVYRVAADGTPYIRGAPLNLTTYAKGYAKQQMSPPLAAWARVPLPGDAGTKDSTSFSAVDGTYTVPSAGVYSISASLTVTNGAAGYYAIVAVAVNGIRLLNIAEFFMTNNIDGKNGAGALLLNAGDKVELQIYLRDGGTVYGDPANKATTQMTVMRLP